MTVRRLNDVSPDEWSRAARVAQGMANMIDGEVYVAAKSRAEDSIVESVVDKYRERSRVGIEKYGTTLERNDLSFDQWLNHISEELMDAVLYIERVRNENRKVGK